MTKRDIAGRTVAVGAIGTLSLAVGGLGVAIAANGGSPAHRTAQRAATSKLASQSYAQTRLDRSIILTTKYVRMVRTAPLKAGTYYVSAAGLLETAANGACIIGTTSTKPVAEGGQFGSGGLAQAAETGAVKVKAHGTISEYCKVVTSSGGESTLNSASITAVRVSHSVKGTVHSS